MSQPVVDAEGVVGRRFQFCPWIEGWAEGQDDFMITCPRCSEFAARCCQHYKYESEKSCHHYRIVFTDGACLSNGKSHATAGIGSAIGATDAEFHQWSIPIDDSVDCFPKQSNQRAELLAAIYGLRLLSDARSNGDVEDDHEHETAQVLSGHMEDKPYWVVTTDSEYVVKGMTEWLPRWKENDWCTVQGRRPANLDLFMKLDEEIIIHEHQHRINIGFWHIPRAYKGVADSLAKHATRIAPVASAQ